MTVTNAHLDAVLKAARTALFARQNEMLTLEEWVDLARAVAAATGRTTADLLTPRDLEDMADLYPDEWDEAVDGPLPKDV
jgi:hypothetical protein